MRSSISSAILALTVSAAALSGQSSSPAGRDQFVTASLGVSFISNLGPHFALVRDRGVVQSGVQFERVWGANKALAFASTAELVAAVVMPVREPLQCFATRTYCLPVARPGTPAAAFGATPLGFKLYVAPQSPVRFFGSVAGGLAAFDRRTPVTQASALNFAAEYLVGAEFDQKDGTAMSVAWKFQHWSNGGSAFLNPGLDANLLYVSFKHRRHRN